MTDNSKVEYKPLPKGSSQYLPSEKPTVLSALCGPGPSIDNSNLEPSKSTKVPKHNTYIAGTTDWKDFTFDSLCEAYGDIFREPLWKRPEEPQLRSFTITDAKIVFDIVKDYSINTLKRCVRPGGDFFADFMSRMRKGQDEITVDKRHTYNRNKVDFGATVGSKPPTGLVIGVIRQSKDWNSDSIKNMGSFYRYEALERLAKVAWEAKPPYGLVITDKEVIVVRLFAANRPSLSSDSNMPAFGAQ